MSWKKVLLCQFCWSVVDQGTASLFGAVFSGGCCVLFVPATESLNFLSWRSCLVVNLILLESSSFYTSRAPSGFTVGTS